MGLSALDDFQPHESETNGRRLIDLNRKHVRYLCGKPSTDTPHLAIIYFFKHFSVEEVTARQVWYQTRSNGACTTTA